MYICIFYFISVGFPLFSLPKIKRRSIMPIDFIIYGTSGKIVEMYTNNELAVYIYFLIEFIPVVHCEITKFQSINTILKMKVNEN